MSALLLPGSARGPACPGWRVLVPFRILAESGRPVDADLPPTGEVRAGEAVVVTRRGLGRYEASFVVPTRCPVGSRLALVIAAEAAGEPVSGVIWEGPVQQAPVPDFSQLTVIQRQYMRDVADVVRLTTDFDAEEENFDVLKQSVPYMHVPTRNLEEFTVVGRQITENIETTDHGLFGEGEHVPSDAYLLNRSGPNPRTGKPNRLNGLYFRVLGPIQPFPSSSSGYADEAMYELRYDEHPHPDLVAVAE